MIRVLIERRVAEGTEDALQRALRDLRREAIHRMGYVSGETLRDAEDPRHYVIISTWRSREDWEAWYRSAERRRVEETIRPFLAEDERITVLEPA